MKKLILLSLSIMLLATHAPLSFAKKYAKTYSSTKEAEVEREVEYILKRSNLQDSFKAKRSDVVTDEELINQITKEATDKAHKRARQKAMERCYDDYPSCQETVMEVLETEIGHIDTDRKVVSDGLGLKINKEAKVEVKVRVEVRGERALSRNAINAADASTGKTQVAQAAATETQTVLPDAVKPAEAEAGASDEE